MNTFDDRKKGFENKFAHDEETLFRINAKRNKLLGTWVADKLEKTDKEKVMLIDLRPIFSNTYF